MIAVLEAALEIQDFLLERLGFGLMIQTACKKHPTQPMFSILTNCLIN